MSSLQAEPRRGFFEREQYDKLSRALPDFLRLPLSIAYFTGMRRGEVLGLTRDKIGFLGGVIRLPGESTKNGRPRIVPITRQVRALLEAQHQRRDQQLPVGFAIDAAKTPAPGRSGTSGKLGRSALTKAGLSPSLLWHDLRRSGVRSLVRSGVSPRVARGVSGRTTKRSSQKFQRSDS